MPDAERRAVLRGRDGGDVDRHQGPADHGAHRCRPGRLRPAGRVRLQSVHQVHDEVETERITHRPRENYDTVLGRGFQGITQSYSAMFHPSYVQFFQKVHTGMDVPLVIRK